MLKITPQEKVMLRICVKSQQGISFSSALRRARLSMPVFIRAVAALIEKGLISDEDGVLRITKDGRNTVFLMRELILGGEKKFREVPEVMLSKKISINEFYIPSKSKLSVEIVDFLKKVT